MPTNLSDYAVRGSNYQISQEFRIPVGDDFLPTKIIPDTARWTLRDKRGNIVNERQDVAIPSSQLSWLITITLMGDDLEPAVAGEAIDVDPVRYLIWEVTYSYGGSSGLPFRDWARFIVVDVP